MDFATALFSILTIHLMASISPGPDFFVVSQKTLLYGRRAGIFCSIGVCVGLLVHIGYSVAGLTTALAHSEHVSQWIGFVGGSYLVFLGSKSIKGSFTKKETNVMSDGREPASRSAFWSGLVVNICNPKAAIYFISLFSIIISPTMSTAKLLCVVISIIAVQMAWYLTFIFLVTIPVFKVKFDSKVHLVDRSLGMLMVLIGLYMIASYTMM